MKPLPRAEQLRLFDQYAPIVRKIAGGFQRKLPRNVLREDILAAGMGGLWDGIRRNGGHADGERFEWYIRVRIRGAILDELRAQDWLARRAREAAEAARGTDAYVPPPAVVRFDDLSVWEQDRSLTDTSNSEAVTAARERLEQIAQAIELLPPRERHIVSQHYYLGVKFKDLGTQLGVSEPRISQIHAAAIGRLRTELTGAPPPKRKRLR